MFHVNNDRIVNSHVWSAESHTRYPRETHPLGGVGATNWAAWSACPGFEDLPCPPPSSRAGTLPASPALCFRRGAPSVQAAGGTRAVSGALAPPGVKSGKFTWTVSFRKDGDSLDAQVPYSLGPLSPCLGPREKGLPSSEPPSPEKDRFLNSMPHPFP